MLPSIYQSRYLSHTYLAYILLFFIFLAAPLVVVGVFAFNDSQFPSLPWAGFTFDWFFSDNDQRLGLFYDNELLESVWISILVATGTTLMALLLACCNAFLFERNDFPGKNLLYIMMLTPLVIPGIILGVSILIFSSSLANWIELHIGLDIEALRPGLFLVVIGQFAFIATICTLVISARLRKFDRSLEEAALNLGASNLTAIWTITIPFLKPALIGAGIISFLMSFENFNTTLILVGSDAPLTITMFDRLREGATPVVNALSLMLMFGSGFLALIGLLLQGRFKSQQQ